MSAHTTRALIVVRTYPSPAKKGVEVSCTAAITDRGEWLRLFPVPYRRLQPHQKFHKYQWISVHTEKAKNDPRPESHKIVLSSLRIESEVLPTDREWTQRKDVVLKLRAPSLCAMKRQRDDHGSPTLGVFKPKRIKRLIIRASEQQQWTEEQLAILRQGDLFEPLDAQNDELEKIPYDFQYEFECDDDACNGHTIICTDWEMGQSFRAWRDQYGDGWMQAFRSRYETDMIERCDTHFYMGTMHAHPQVWIIVGLFYPPKSVLPLFPD